LAQRKARLPTDAAQGNPQDRRQKPQKKRRKQAMNAQKILHTLSVIGQIIQKNSLWFMADYL
jgi:hypothetical protein